MAAEIQVYLKQMKVRWILLGKGKPLSQDAPIKAGNDKWRRRSRRGICSTARD